MNTSTATEIRKRRENPPKTAQAAPEGTVEAVEAATPAPEPTSEVNEAPVSAFADGSMDEFISKLARKLGLDGARGKAVFRNTGKPSSHAIPENLEQTMKRALAKAREGGHRFQVWYREREAPDMRHIPQNTESYHSKCVQCGRALVVQMLEPQRDPNGKPMSEYRTPTFTGKVLGKSCLSLQGKSGREEVDSSFRNIKD